jgi:hypothetical protein
LMLPPLRSTTRMIANSSTTDSEMATTDHTLGRSALPARRYGPRTPARTIVPPTRPAHADRDATSDTRPLRAMRRTGIRPGRRCVTGAGITRLRCCLHTSCAQVIRIDGTETPYAPFSADESGHRG